MEWVSAGAAPNPSELSGKMVLKNMVSFAFLKTNWEPYLFIYSTTDYFANVHGVQQQASCW